MNASKGSRTEAPLERAMEFIDRVENASSLEELTSWFAEAVEVFGVTHWAVAQVADSRVAGSLRVLTAQQPSEWVTNYVRRHYHKVDPVVPELFRRSSPFMWGQLRRSDEAPTVVRLFGEIKEFGIADGLIVPWHGAHGEVGCVTLQGERLDTGPREMATLRLLGLYYAEVVKDLTDAAREEQSITLTKRQLDCLSWAAEGKTDWEISAILGISEKTVARHFEDIRQRLNVATRTQALVIALRCGWLVRQLG